MLFLRISRLFGVVRKIYEVYLGVVLRPGNSRRTIGLLMEFSIKIWDPAFPRGSVVRNSAIEYELLVVLSSRTEPSRYRQAAAPCARLFSGAFCALNPGNSVVHNSNIHPTVLVSSMKAWYLDFDERRTGSSGYFGIHCTNLGRFQVEVA